MIYCLENKIKFQLYSINTMYGNDIWKDYFHEFTEHQLHFFHKTYNGREYGKVFKSDFDNSQNSEIKEYLEKTFYRQEICLTQNIWHNIRNHTVYNSWYKVNSDFLSGSILNVSHQIIKSIWKYNSSTSSKVQDIKNTLKIDHNYAGIHIRRGDKFKEVPVVALEKYLQTVDKATEQENYPVFIATDDQRIIEQVKTFNPKRVVYHFNCPDNQGFDMDTFSTLPAETQKNHIVQLLAEVEMLIEANLFVGTFTSNVGMFVGMARDGKDLYGVDTAGWIVW